MKKFFIIFVLVVIGIWLVVHKEKQIVPSSSSPQNTTVVNASKIHGWLHAQGMQLYDQENNPVRLVGMTVNGMEIGSGYPGVEEKQHTGCPGWKVPLQTEYDNIATWGFNSVRVSLSWADLEPTPPTKNADGSYAHNWNQSYLQDADVIVNEFRKRGIPIIIGLHQFNWSPAFKDITQPLGHFCQGQGMPVWTLPNAKNENGTQAFCDFFANKTEGGVPIDVQLGFIEASKFLAQRYKNNTTVIGIDMFNEPYAKKLCSASDLNLDDFYQKTGVAIRSVNPNILLIFQDTGNKMLNDLGLKGPIPFSNTLYAFHLYPKSFSQSQQISDVYLQRAKQWNVPLWAGEWGAIGSQRSDISDTDTLQNLQMLQYWKENNINWTVWAYWGGFGITYQNSDKPKTTLLKTLQQGF